MSHCPRCKKDHPPTECLNPELDAARLRIVSLEAECITLLNRALAAEERADALRRALKG